MKNSPQQQVDSWNAGVKVGDGVSYRDDCGRTVLTRTRTPASVLGGHTAVVWIDGRSGCVLLDRVTLITREIAS